jgi:HK97 family phage major capsid protein
MSATETIDALYDTQRRALEAQEAIIARGKMDAAGEAEFDKAQADFEQASAEIKRHQAVAENQKVTDTAQEIREARARAEREHPGVTTPTPGGDLPKAELNEREHLRQFLRGDHQGYRTDDGSRGFDVNLRGAAQFANMVRSGADAKELRSLLGDGGASGGSLVVPTIMAQTIYGFLEASGAVRQLANVFQSENANWTLPRVNTHGVGTQVIAQGTAIGGTDPIFDTITLNAFKFGQLVQVSNEMAFDAAFDIVSFVTENVARAVGRRIATGYATGSGSSTINGLVTATTGSVITGGSLITISAENLIDAQHAVVQEYRDNGSYIMLDSTLGTVRKLRADAGGTIGPWLLEPPSAPGQPLTLFGRPVFTDFNIAAQGSNAMSVVFGDVSKYYIKDTGAFRFERSDDFAFNTDLISYRGVIRTDGDLVDTRATVKIRQNV